MIRTENWKTALWTDIVEHLDKQELKQHNISYQGGCYSHELPNGREPLGHRLWTRINEDLPLMHKDSYYKLRFECFLNYVKDENDEWQLDDPDGEILLALCIELDLFQDKDKEEPQFGEVLFEVSW
jgi:hypothetical protein